MENLWVTAMADYSGNSGLGNTNCWGWSRRATRNMSTLLHGQTAKANLT